MAARTAAEKIGKRVHLIVGVGSDESAEEYKCNPIIPFAQRMELIRSISGVDEVIEAPSYPEKSFYEKHRIDLHYQGEDNPGMSFYETAKQLGILRLLGRQEILSSTEILDEIENRRDS